MRTVCLATLLRTKTHRSATVFSEQHRISTSQLVLTELAMQHACTCTGHFLNVLQLRNPCLHLTTQWSCSSLYSSATCKASTSKRVLPPILARALGLSWTPSCSCGRPAALGTAGLSWKLLATAWMDSLINSNKFSVALELGEQPISALPLHTKPQ